MITIGLIDYLNTQPFQHFLAERLEGKGVRFVRGVPTMINQALLNGEVDLAPISAIEAARHAEEVVILPGLGIASLGAVKTVLLFSWKPDPRELAHQPIALTDHSATAVALLKLLFHERYTVEAEWRTRPQNLAAMMNECQGALVIGDAALVEASQHRMLITPTGETARPYVFDLGDEWLKHTGLPFVFALWAARRAAVPELLALDIPQTLNASTADGLEAIDTLASAYAPRLGLPVGVCSRYLRDLRYQLTDWDMEGLKTYLDAVLGEKRRPLEFLELVEQESLGNGYQD
jgi:chorismate dehydratase